MLTSSGNAASAAGLTEAAATAPVSLKKSRLEVMRNPLKNRSFAPFAVEWFC
jgi:hypothetical protein